MTNYNNQTKTEFSTTEIITNRAKFMLKPIVTLVTLPVKGIKKFSDAIVAEAEADLERNLHSQKVKNAWDEYNEERKRVFELSIAELRSRASVEPLDVRVISNRINGRKGGRPRKVNNEA